MSILNKITKMPLIRGSLCSLAILMTACARTPLQGTANANVWVYKQLPSLAAAKDWEIFLGAKGEIGLPIEAFVRLYARKAGTVCEIKGSQSFFYQTKAKPITARDALDVVRFFTNKQIVPYLTRPFYVDTEENNCPRTALIETNHCFVIERELGFCQKDEQCDILVYIVRETIKPNGIYQIQRVKKVRTISCDSLGLVPYE